VASTTTSNYSDDFQTFLAHGQRRWRTTVRRSISRLVVYDGARTEFGLVNVWPVVLPSNHDAIASSVPVEMSVGPPAFVS